MPTRWVIGLASGSSGDGVDAALVESQGVGLELRPRLLQRLHQAFPRDLRELVRRVGAGGARSPSGRPVASAARRDVRGSRSLRRGCGQSESAAGTVHWLSGPHDLARSRRPFSLHPRRSGMPSIIAERHRRHHGQRLPLRDVAAGGQGVPLAALTDYFLFRHPQESRVLLHLGGMAPASSTCRRAAACTRSSASRRGRAICCSMPSCAI